MCDSRDSEDLYIDSSGNKWLNSTYLNKFSLDVKELIGSTMIEYHKVSTNEIGINNTSLSIFLVSFREYGLSKPSNMGPLVGSDIFTIGGQIRIAKYLNQPVFHAVRDIATLGIPMEGFIDEDGNAHGGGIGNNPYLYFRPCFTIPSTIMIDNELLINCL